MRRRPRRGLTLVEVLVALTVFAVLAAATAGLQATALRLSRRADAVRALSGVLEAQAVPARARDAGWDPCGVLPRVRACRVRRSPCCGPREALARVEVTWTPERASPVTLRLLARRAP